MIAKRQKTPLARLRECNPAVRRHKIFPGQKLKLKCSATKTNTASNKTKVHVVKNGESLWRIAKKYGVSINDITRWNKLRSSSKIFAGRKLKVSDDNEG